MKKLNFKTKIFIAALLLLGSIGTAYSANATVLSNIDFAGRTWTVKSGNGGPGPNNWGNTDQDIFVDGSGLHLKVSQHDDDQKWYSSEVYLPGSLGYGKYTFDINSRVDLLDQNLVAAPFLYQDDNHEIDIEHSLWNGETGTNNLFYTVQPYNKAGNQQKTSSAFSNGVFQDIIDWQPDKINFSTKQNGNEISSFTYTTSTDGTTNNFNPGNELVHINFWQYKGLVPSNTTTSEFIVSNFAFDPYVAPATSTISTPTPTSTPTNSLTVNLNIRYQNGFIFSDPVTLATSTIIVDDTGSSTFTTSTTVLTALINAAKSTTAFSISDLQLSSYGYYLKCLYLANIATSTCNNWNYVVNNSYPAVGMGNYPLTGGENIYIYFGDSWKITTPNSIVNTNTSTPFYTWKYDYSDTTHDWVMDPNDLVAITTPNPNPTGWWDTDTIVSTTNSNDQGVANYFFTTTGTYSAKITSNDYSKWSNPVTVIVTNTPVEQTSTSTNTPTNPGSGGSSNSNQIISDSIILSSVDKILNFLKSHQDTDGKIVDGGTSDWTAMSFGAKGIYASDIKNGDKSLYDFVYNIKTEDIEKESNKCAGYSRHILALLSSGVSKTDPKIIELKNKLDTTCVQNNIFGLSGINDDIFGLMAALALDENATSVVVTTTLASIKADQQIDGSFTWNGWAGADMTGAAINALKYTQSKGINIDNNIFTKAKQYLKSQQHTDGGWGCYDYNNGCLESDALTTGWAVMGINSLGETQNDWFNSAGKNPWYILTTLDNDHFTPSWGGIDWFATKHAVPALLGKTWPIILDPKPVTNNQNNGGGGAASQSTVSTTLITTSTLNSTTTIAITTSTTSTLPIISTTTLITEISTSTTSTLIIEKTERKPIIILSRNLEIKKNTSTTTTNVFNQTTTTQPQQELSAGKPQIDENKTLDNLPLDTPTKRNAKKILAISGGSALMVGAYLGLRLFKNVI